MGAYSGIAGLESAIARAQAEDFTAHVFRMRNRSGLGGNAGTRATLITDNNEQRLSISISLGACQTITSADGTAPFADQESAIRQAQAVFWLRRQMSNSSNESHPIVVLGERWCLWSEITRSLPKERLKRKVQRQPPFTGLVQPTIASTLRPFCPLRSMLSLSVMRR